MAAEKQLTPGGQVQSVHRALTILNTVARYPEGIGVRELARQVGLKPPTAHAIVKTLLEFTYLERCQDSRRYQLGLGAVMLGFGAGTNWNSRIAGTVRDELEQLAQQLNETVVLFGYINGLVVCLDCINAERELVVQMKAGVFIQVPHMVANGKVLLANSEQLFQETYAREKALVNDLGEEYDSADALLQDLARIRQTGHAEVVNVNNSGVYGASVEIEGFFGRRDLAVGCCLPLSRLNDARRAEIMSALHASAKAMQQKIKAHAERMR